jgi:hypothetical protein
MYSPGMKTLGELGVVWTEENLDKWLTNPKAMLPDSYMSMFLLLMAQSGQIRLVRKRQLMTQSGHLEGMHRDWRRLRPPGHDSTANHQR